MLWLEVKEKWRRYPVDHGCALWGFLPVGTPELRVEDRALEVDKKVLLYVIISSHLVSLEEILPQKPWRGPRKLCIKMLGEAALSLLKQLKQVAESGFKVSL